MDQVILIMSGALALAWVPIFYKFWSAFRTRQNPVSLAICGLIGFVIYLHGSAYFFVKSDIIWVIAVTSAMSLLVLANFFFSFYWSKKKFPEARGAVPRRDG